MEKRGSFRKKKKDKWSNRLAIVGITMVVISLGVVVNVKSSSLREKEREYQVKEETLLRQLEEEKARTEKLEEERIYVGTKQYIEKVAKEKLGLVKPDEILLKPERKH